MAQKFYEEWAIVATIDPASQTASEKLSDEIDLKNYLELAAVVLLGALGSSGTVDGTFKAASTSGGSYAAVTGTGITQLTQAGSDDNKQIVVHLRGDQTGGKEFVKFSLTPGTAASLAAAVVFGKPRFGPATDQDLASVDEVVTP